MSERKSPKLSSSVVIAVTVVVAAILVAVLLPTRICTYNSCINNLIPDCLKATCSGVAELPRLVITGGGLLAAAIVLTWHRRS
jgi:hypothetical protein